MFAKRWQLIQFVRNYRNRKYVDPGIQRRKAAIQYEEKDVDLELDETDFDDLETDFMNVNKTHKEHIQELEKRKERLKNQIVKQKYFKTKYPNFLTWNDKEQIKYLHSTNPEEWTIDRLSESFPALPGVIEKIINSKFTKNESKIMRHDASVQENWKAFKNGEMENLPEHLKEHLKKFSDRSLNFKPFEIPKKIEVVEKLNIPTEFSEIITSYENKINSKNQIEESPSKEENNSEKQMDIIDQEEKTNKSKVWMKNITLQQLRDEIKSGIISGKEIQIDDKVILDHSKENDANIVKLDATEIRDMMQSTKYQSSAELINKTEKDYSHLIYPEKITIPKNKWKHGYTYKVNDCYYDSDGTFLYRVPGMG